MFGSSDDIDDSMLAMTVSSNLREKITSIYNKTNDT